MRSLSWIAPTVLVVALTGRSSTAAGTAGKTNEPIIPAGQEQLLGAMLGRGETLPGGCRFDGGQVNAVAIRVTYTCASGPVMLELRHPSRAPAAVDHTRQFAIVPYGGTPPDGLIAALVSRIGAREGAFEWKSLDPIRVSRDVVRLNVLAFVLCTAIVAALKLSRVGRGTLGNARTDMFAAGTLTAVAALLRFLVAANVSEMGGIGYSRMLVGYAGHLATPELYSLVYAWTGRDLEHAILLNRIASTLTVPLVYAICRRLVPEMRSVAVIAATLLAAHPLHLLFSPTDALPISTSLLAAASYLLLTASVVGGDTAWRRALAAVGATTGLALLTQVRFENVIFLVPAFIYVLVYRRTLRIAVIAPAAIVGAAFLVAYGRQALDASRGSGLPLLVNLRAAADEVLANPMFAIAPVLVGSAAATIHRRSRIRWMAPLPLLALVPIVALAIRFGSHDYASGADVVALGRVYVNELVPLAIVTAYGLALLWTSARRGVRALAVVSLVWAVALPVVFWSTLRERHVEIVEHEFFRRSLVMLPPGAGPVIVPDDELLSRQAHSTIELLAKYQLINDGAARPARVIGMTEFLEHADEIDCSRGDCLFFNGVPCTDGRLYAFAQAQCAAVMARSAGPPVAERELIASSFRDCAMQHGAARRRLCNRDDDRRRLGLYRISN